MLSTHHIFRVSVHLQRPMMPSVCDSAQLQILVQPVISCRYCCWWTAVVLKSKLVRSTDPEPCSNSLATLTSCQIISNSSTFPPPLHICYTDENETSGSGPGSLGICCSSNCGIASTRRRPRMCVFTSVVLHFEHSSNHWAFN